MYARTKSQMDMDTSNKTGMKDGMGFIPVGGTFSVNGKVYECCEGDVDCIRCALCKEVCIGFQCNHHVRQDGKEVYFREVESQEKEAQDA